MIAIQEKTLNHRCKDEVGNKYSRLIVVANAGRDKHKNVIWLCRCDCGVKKIISGQNLRRGATKSCGCLGRETVNRLTTPIDEVGNRYGKLTILEYAESNEGRGSWLCQCDCGEKKIVSGSSLRRGLTKSCGCSRRSPKGEAAFNKTYNSIKHSAKIRGHSFELTKEQVRDFVVRPCFYCGASPSQISRSKWDNGDFAHSGLDRINSNLGYSEDNVVTCCWGCNRSKGTSTVEEFKSWLTGAYKHFIKGEGRK